MTHDNASDDRTGDDLVDRLIEQLTASIEREDIAGGEPLTPAILTARFAIPMGTAQHVLVGLAERGLVTMTRDTATVTQRRFSEPADHPGPETEIDVSVELIFLESLGSGTAVLVPPSVGNHEATVQTTVCLHEAPIALTLDFDALANWCVQVQHARSRDPRTNAYNHVRRLARGVTASSDPIDEPRGAVDAPIYTATVWDDRLSIRDHTDTEIAASRIEDDTPDIAILRQGAHRVGDWHDTERGKNAYVLPGWHRVAYVGPVGIVDNKLTAGMSLLVGSQIVDLDSTTATTLASVIAEKAQNADGTPDDPSAADEPSALAEETAP
ncbi:hypothetical protein [Phytoactinopolyspora endophytica]|uniref:hypothetical protein n=1 Tax=Phytoactinopolyspora endophytica TaxID=1642495 RepID=UPI00101C79E1|nr:hypothetical protein [Phytoactinopolyspora endophytica]